MVTELMSCLMKLVSFNIMSMSASDPMCGNGGGRGEGVRGIIGDGIGLCRSGCMLVLGKWL